MIDNILRVTFGKELKVKSRPLYQYDYGQKLKFLDLNLPEAYEVHFSNYEHGTATITVATSNEVAIPDIYLQTGLNIFVCEKNGEFRVMYAEDIDEVKEGTKWLSMELLQQIQLEI